MKPVHIDGLLYVLIAISGTAVATLSSDEAYKYIAPTFLYWAKFFFALTGAGSTALKTYRSTSYANRDIAALQPPAPVANSQTEAKIQPEKPL